MYIPIWLIIIVAITGIYFYSRTKKSGGQNALGLFKQPFSYKLDISVEPNWYNLYKKIANPKSEKEFEKAVEEKIKKLEKDNESSLWGRRYLFTEYHDSVSGLTTRFQRVICPNGKQYFYPVNEFGDHGYVFDSDDKFDAHEGEEERNARQKLSVNVGEDFIRNDIFDKYIGGRRSDFDYEKENYVFQFPLSEVFSFLFELGQRFHETEDNPVIKWPDQIEKKFKEYGIDYETHFEYEQELFDIEKHDKGFFEKWGKPKIALYGKRTENTYLVSKDKHYYGVELKLFRPDENERVGINA